MTTPDAGLYEPPMITTVGSLHELTLDSPPVGKDFAPISDGFSFQGQPINVS